MRSGPPPSASDTLLFKEARMKIVITYCGE